MSKVMDLPDNTREEHLELLNRIYIYPIGIKMTGDRLELHLDNGRI